MENEIKNNFSNDMVTTHFDLRKLAEETANHTLANTNEWQKILDEYLAIIIRILESKRDKKEVDFEKEADKLHAKIDKLIKKQVDGDCEFMARQTADAYNIGMIESHISSVNQYSDLLDKLVDEERVADPFGTLKKVSKITRELCDKQFGGMLKDKPLMILKKDEK